MKVDLIGAWATLVLGQAKRQQEQRTHDTMLCRKEESYITGIEYNACLRVVLVLKICYRLYEVVRSIESITVLSIRMGPFVGPVLLDY